MQPTQKTKMTGRKKAGLWLLIGPTALLVAGFMVFAIVNWIAAAVTPPLSDSSALFGNESTGTMVSNVILFLISIVGFLTWLPGLIIGIILLATPKRQ